MAVFAFLGLAYCQREGGHIRMDIVVDASRGRAALARGVAVDRCSC